MIIGIDFYGTCVTHDYPEMGKDIGAVPVLKSLVDKGHKLILFTMRSDKENADTEQYLTDAANWFKENDIPLFGIQTNPTQHTWTNSPKAYCDLYIDDSALGCPIKYDTQLSAKPFVDWLVVQKLLEQKAIL
jgi:hypothetical protein